METIEEPLKCLSRDFSLGCSHLRTAVYTLSLWKLFTVRSRCKKKKYSKHRCVRQSQQTLGGMSLIHQGFSSVAPSAAHEAKMPGSQGQHLCSLRDDADVTSYGTGKMMSQMQSWHAPAQKEVQTDLQGHVEMLTSLSCARWILKTYIHTYKDTHSKLVCIRAVQWWAMEVSPATACGLRSSVVLTGRGGLWDRSGDSGLSDCSRCCQPAVFPLSAPSSSSLSSTRLPVFFFPIFHCECSLGSWVSPPTCISNANVWIGTLYIVNHYLWVTWRAFF